jgi:5-oxoprolinase (ATP-hydrolysing) subunit A
MAGDIVATECREAGIRMVHEGYVDIDYNADGGLVMDRARVARDPEAVAARAIALIERQGAEAIDGTWINISAKSICLHGDMANAIDIAHAVRRRILDAGHRIVGVRDLVA